VRVTDAGTPPLTSTVTFVVRLNATVHRHHQLRLSATSTNLALPLVICAAAAVVLVVVCLLLVRRIGARSAGDHITAVPATTTYWSRTSIDDLASSAAAAAADCSTDVAIGSSVRLQVEWKFLVRRSSRVMIMIIH